MEDGGHRGHVMGETLARKMMGKIGARLSRRTEDRDRGSTRLGEIGLHGIIG